MKQRFGQWKKISVRTGTTAAMAVSALILTAGISVKDSLAYFTTYVTAQGGQTITLGNSTTITEEFKDWKKTIQVENVGETDCYVRVKIFAGERFTITPSGENWKQGADGYWYYGKEVAVGEMTKALTVSISYPADLEADFDVVVVQECTPVTYDEKGKACGIDSADWSRAAITGEGADG